MDNELAKNLIREILGGQTGRFAELVEWFKTPIYTLALRMTGSATDAQDLTQEIFIRAWLNLDKYDQRYKFFTWLYTLALNLIRNHLKKTSRQTPVAAAFPEQLLPDKTADADPAQSLAAREERREINNKLLRLPAEQREALLLRFFQDVSFEDMAAIMWVGVSAAKMRVGRGLVALRKMMRDE